MTSPEQPLDWTPRTAPLGQPAAPVTGPTGYPPAYGPPPPRPAGRRRLIIGLSVAIAVALLAVGGTITALALHGQSAPAATPSPTCDVVGANGCTTKGSDGGGPAAAPSWPASPSTSTPPPPIVTMPAGKRYADAIDLVNDLAAVGLPCGTPERVDNPSLAQTLIDCGPNVTVATYRTHAEAIAATRALVRMTAGSGTTLYFAIGANWDVNAGSADYAHRIVDAFHAEYYEQMA